MNFMICTAKKTEQPLKEKKKNKINSMPELLVGLGGSIYTFLVNFCFQLQCDI